MHVELVSVEREVWSGEASMVVARTTEGEIGVLPGHAPLLGQLAEQRRVTRQDADLALRRTGDDRARLAAPDLSLDRDQLDVQSHGDPPGRL